MWAKTSTSIICVKEKSFQVRSSCKTFSSLFSLFFFSFFFQLLVTTCTSCLFLSIFLIIILDHWRFALPAFQHVCECDCLHFNEKLSWKYADYETFLVFVLGGALVKFQRYNIHGERRSRFYNSLLGNKVKTSLTEFWNTHNNFLIPRRLSGSL